MSEQEFLVQVFETPLAFWYKKKWIDEYWLYQEQPIRHRVLNRVKFQCVFLYMKHFYLSQMHHKKITRFTGTQLRERKLEVSKGEIENFSKWKTTTKKTLLKFDPEMNEAELAFIGVKINREEEKIIIQDLENNNEDIIVRTYGLPAEVSEDFLIYFTSHKGNYIEKEYHPNPDFTAEKITQEDIMEGWEEPRKEEKNEQDNNTNNKAKDSQDEEEFFGLDDVNWES